MSVIILYTTREGQTARIAEHMAATLRARGVAVDVHQVPSESEEIDWTRYGAAVVAASVHATKHEPEMIRFVMRHRSELERLHAAFVSVSLTQAGVQDPNAPAERRMKAQYDVQRMIDSFVKRTGWHPAHTLPVAGALAYSHYNFLVRFVLKRIAHANGAPTDTSRDYEFTDWSAIDRFVQEVVAPAWQA